MPQRFLKPGLITSRKWDSCTWMAQSFYVRLLTLVDDYGRYEADSVLLRSHAFPLREDVRGDTVEKLCLETSDAHLVYYYQLSGKRYLQLVNWTEKPRSDKSKYPDPCDERCTSVYANAITPLELAAERSGTPPSSSSSSPSSSSFDQFWLVYPRKVGKGEAEKKFATLWDATQNPEELVAKMLSAVEQQKRSPQWQKDGGQYIPHPTTWLNQKRWEDEAKIPTSALQTQRKLDTRWMRDLGDDKSATTKPTPPPQPST